MRQSSFTRPCLRKDYIINKNLDDLDLDEEADDDDDDDADCDDDDDDEP